MTPPDLIQLANCNAHQLTKDGKKGDWIIRENITDAELFRFNGRISDEDMFAIMKFARQYELIALNTGIQHQKGRQDKTLEEANMRLLEESRSILAHNEFLAETVERLTAGEN